ncbi:MAG: YraN family protein [Spirochaetota bacterium]
MTRARSSISRRTRTSSSLVRSIPRNSQDPNPDRTRSTADEALATASSTRERGRAGEELATRFLTDQGYLLLERNFRIRLGEVDIIAVKGGTIAFCEVKSWERMPREGLEQAIDHRKQGRIIRTSLWYLHRHPNLLRLQPRYDVLFVSHDRVDHLTNAFSERGAW